MLYTEPVKTPQGVQVAYLLAFLGLIALYRMAVHAFVPDPKTKRRVNLVALVLLLLVLGWAYFWNPGTT